MLLYSLVSALYQMTIIMIPSGVWFNIQTSIFCFFKGLFYVFGFKHRLCVQTIDVLNKKTHTFQMIFFIYIYVNLLSIAIGVVSLSAHKANMSAQ